MASNVYCACDRGSYEANVRCMTVVATGEGMALPPEQLADNFVFDIEGDVDYIELFVRDHVLGRTLRNAKGNLYVVGQEEG